MKIRKYFFAIISAFFICMINIDAAEKLNCNKILKQGLKGNEVRLLQKMLNKVSLCGTKIDGDFGPKTMNCVRSYQQAKKINVSGQVNKKTCELLNSDYNSGKTVKINNKSKDNKIDSKKINNGNNDCVKNNTPLTSNSNSVTVLGGGTLKRGMSGDNIRLLKQELNKVMNCKLETNPKFDNSTYNCVVRFQKKYKLSADGVVSSATINALNKAYKNKQVIATSGVSIKKSDSSSSSTITTASKGTRLNILGVCNGWYKVEYNGKIGYVLSKQVRATFVEVDITSQVLRFYKDGNLYLDTLVTTGKSGSNGTPKGYRTVVTKKRNNVLQPSNAKVDYWIATDSRGAIGIHDASWRGNNPSYKTYGGTIYKGRGNAGSSSSGSHGCINTPLNKVSKIYNNISVGDPIIIY